jgi:hypothetical protein
LTTRFTDANPSLAPPLYGALNSIVPGLIFHVFVDGCTMHVLLGPIIFVPHLPHFLRFFILRGFHTIQSITTFVHGRVRPPRRIAGETLVYFVEAFVEDFGGESSMARRSHAGTMMKARIAVKTPLARRYQQMVDRGLLTPVFGLPDTFEYPSIFTSVDSYASAGVGEVKFHAGGYDAKLEPGSK